MGCWVGSFTTKEVPAPQIICSVEPFSQRPPGRLAAPPLPGISLCQWWGQALSTLAPCPCPGEAALSLLWPLQGPGQVLRSFGERAPGPDSESNTGTQVPLWQLASCGSQGWGFKARDLSLLTGPRE